MYSATDRGHEMGGRCPYTESGRSDVKIKVGDRQLFDQRRSSPVMINPLSHAPEAIRLRVVESDLIYAVGYTESSQTLVIVSNQGKIYQYFEVPKTVYEELVASGSVDQYLRQSILGHYACVQVKRRGRKRHR